MTRDDDRNGIAVVRHPDRAESTRMPNRVGDVAVAARLAVRDIQQRTPALQLEIRAAEVEWKRKLLAMPGKIFFELAKPRLESGGRFLPGLIPAFSRLAAVEFQPHQAARGNGQQELTRR